MFIPDQKKVKQTDAADKVSGKKSSSAMKLHKKHLRESGIVLRKEKVEESKQAAQVQSVKKQLVPSTPITVSIAGPAVSTTQITLPVQQPVQATQTSTAVVPQTQEAVQEIRKQASNLYYPNLPVEERVKKLVEDGCTNEQIAMRLDMSLKAVMDARKKVRTRSLIQAPRELFSERLVDFNDAFDTAKKLFNDTPESEISYKIMCEFARTMRELIKDYNELEDPRELALVVINQGIQPLVESILKTVVDGFKATIKNVSPFLKEQERIMLNDSLTNGLRTLQDNVNGNYNNAVGVLERIFNVELEASKVRAKSKTDLKSEQQPQINNVQAIQI